VKNDVILLHFEGSQEAVRASTLQWAAGYRVTRIPDLPGKESRSSPSRTEPIFREKLAHMSLTWMKGRW